MQKIYSTKEVKIPVYYKPQLTITGNIAEFRFCSNFSHASTIKKINKNEYMYICDTATHEKGEICEYQHHNKTRKDDIANVLRSVKKCRQMINSNFFGERNELFITLTYTENMQDTKKLYEDLKRFIKNLKKFLKNQEIKYLYVVEPQGRGAWHAHILLKNMSWTSLENQWYIAKSKIKELWSYKGFVLVEKISNIDDLGSYLSSYLTNLEKGKKNSRLHLYPRGINIFRCSRNCDKPVIVKNKNFKNAYEFLKKQWVLDELPQPTYTATQLLLIDDFQLAVSTISINRKRAGNKKFILKDYIDGTQSTIKKFFEKFDEKYRDLLAITKNSKLIKTQGGN